MPISVISVFGTRPEAIKMAPVVKALEEDPRFSSQVLVTAQHREMLDQVLEAFSITPDFDLDLMEHGQTLAQITEKVLKGATEVFEQERPDIVLVHGDTTTTFATALAAAYLDIDVGHVEAGMRTWDIKQPFPEELNRTLVTHLARWHFAPSKECEANLLRSGVSPELIIRTQHNTGVDALLYARGLSDKGAKDYADDKTDKDRRSILVTAHRRESWGEPMRRIFSAIAQIAEARPELMIRVATHANPLVSNDAQDILGDIPNIELLRHQHYLDFIGLMAQATLILSDSGGIQEEGPTLGVPVVVLREKTEYHELLDAGVVKLAGTQETMIVKTALALLEDVQTKEKVLRFAQAREKQSSIPSILEALASGNSEGRDSYIESTSL